LTQRRTKLTVGVVVSSQDPSRRGDMFVTAEMLADAVSPSPGHTAKMSRSNSARTGDSAEGSVSPSLRDLMVMKVRRDRTRVRNALVEGNAPLVEGNARPLRQNCPHTSIQSKPGGAY
jgi:hypothetical protein